jgi:DNA end-binding protein Ku
MVLALDASSGEKGDLKMPRSSWQGYLKLSLVSVPVKGYTSSVSASQVRLNQLHAECHSRIRYQKTCPIHGEVPKEEIVSGYEYADGQYVVIDPAEIARLRGDSEKAVTIEAVVPQNSIDPVYFTERTYYLVPDGAVGQKPFALLQKGLADQELQAVGHAVLFRHEEMVLIRPVENLLAMTALKYESEVAHAATLADELDTPELKNEELKLTRTLLEAFTKEDFFLADYKDHYAEELRQLVEAKVEGKELVTPPATEEAPVINLMDALKRSLAAAKKGNGASPSRKPRRKAAQITASGNGRRAGGRRVRRRAG